MDYIRNRLFHANRDGNKHDGFEEQAIVIHPGQVEEATHIVSIPGTISLAELRFWAYVPDPHDYNSEMIANNNNDSDRLPPASESAPSSAAENDQPKFDSSSNQSLSQQQQHRQINDSYIDIAVFEIPVQCSSQISCDLTNYGIGKIEYFDGIKFLSLCDDATGRLLIDEEKFHGYRTEKHIPPSGILMKDRITDPKASTIPSFPSRDTKYEVLIANCDKHAYGTGRNIELSGQVMFDSDPWFGGSGQGSSSLSSHHHVGTQHQQELYGGPPLDAISQIKLISIGLSIFVFFALFSLRIHYGTRADYFTARVNRNNQIINSNSDGVENSSSSSRRNEEMEEEDTTPQPLLGIVRTV